MKYLESTLEPIAMDEMLEAEVGLVIFWQLLLGAVFGVTCVQSTVPCESETLCA